MKQHELKPAPGSHRARKRIGRGISAGQGKTSGRGQKGQGSRSSVGIPVSFEGGQMPLAQRLPKLRGFHNLNRVEYATVNLGKLSRFPAGSEVGPQLLLETGVIRKALAGVKILGAGELKVALKVSAHRVSAGARKAIEAAGGSVELLGPQRGDEPEDKRKRGKTAAKAAAGARAEAALAEAAPAEPTPPKTTPAAGPREEPTAESSSPTAEEPSADAETEE
jgi:large subunit ribosomal protein L15